MNVQRKHDLVDNSYLGWSNRETWAVQLWITQEPLLTHHWSMRTLLLDWPDLTRELKETYDVLYVELAANPTNLTRHQREMLIDIGSFHRVNWIEIALSLKGVRPDSA